jgi:hypothetical protein
MNEYGRRFHEDERFLGCLSSSIYLVVEKARAALTEERAKRGVVLAATLGAEERRAAES